MAIRNVARCHARADDDIERGVRSTCRSELGDEQEENDEPGVTYAQRHRSTGAGHARHRRRSPRPSKAAFADSSPARSLLGPLCGSPDLHMRGIASLPYAWVRLE